ncbi:MAG TPA: hypothetical protein VD908_07650 [Cytophagales bacterium]|nr:hypothetical protein [Cytophagales bacterium]
MAAEWRKKTDATNLKVGRDSYLRMIDGLIYGEDPKQGFVENNVFYHPVLKFQFPIPSGWAYQNTPQQVQMAEKNGKAMMLLELAKGNSLENAGRAVLEKYQLTLVESKQETVNGLPAIAMIADQISQQQQQQQAIRTLIYLIQFGGNIYTMIGVSSSADFNGYFNAFQNTMKSFAQLTDQEKINKKPEKIRIKSVSQGGTMAQALRQQNVKEDRMEELAILNGMKLTDKVEKGMLFKVVE